MILYVHDFPDGKQYIGVTSKTLAARVKSGYGTTPVAEAMKTFDGGIVPRVILTGPEELVRRLEAHFIEAWGTILPDGYNARWGGFGGRTHPNTAAKMSAAWTPERRAAQAERTRDMGKKLVQEVNERKRTPEGRAAGSARMKAYWSDPINRQAQADRIRKWHSER